MKTIEELEREVDILKQEIGTLKYLLDNKQDKENYEFDDDRDGLDEEDIEEMEHEYAVETVSNCKCGAYYLTKEGKLYQVSDCIC